MQLNAPGRPHLCYCTNIHAGESWGEIRANLERFVTQVKARVAPERRFGVGLRLGAQAAAELTAPTTIALFRAWLEEQGLYVFTINGFPHGAFHGRRVKEQVYRPDWREPERLRYTNELAALLAKLLPDDIDGSVSTVPGAFKSLAAADGQRERIAQNIALHAAELVRLERETGRRIALALEPEPECMLETIAETVRFYQVQLLSERALSTLGERAGLTGAAREAAMRRHVGVCLDTCHAAVEFEDPEEAVAVLGRADIRVAKMQLSAGLLIARLDGGALEALEPFDEDVYLHQVVEQGGDGELTRFLDLGDAIEDAGRRGFEPAREWRVHFHVPIFAERLGAFEGTQAFLARVLALQKREPFATHLEVETYTWDVLPAEHRSEDVVTAIARELSWVVAQLEP